MVHAALELMNLLPQLLKFRDYMLVPPKPAKIKLLKTKFRIELTIWSRWASNSEISPPLPPLC